MSRWRTTSSKHTFSPRSQARERRARRAAILTICLTAIWMAAPAWAERDRAHGPKKTIAVASFDAHGAFLASYGGWDLGGGLAAMLAVELTQTERFNVVTRADLDPVLAEQEYALRGLTAASTVQSGQLLGAQYLVRGSVTEFEASRKGGGFSFGGGFGGFLGALSPRKEKGHVAIDLSVIDTTTGEVVAAFTADEEISRTALVASLSHKDFSVGRDSFDATPLGEAVRAAIREAVEQVADALTGAPWEATVAQVSGATLYVNAGRNSDLRPGDVLSVHRVIERVVDPVTGALLGFEEQPLGTATVDTVKERYATASFTTWSPPATGDTLRLTLDDAR